MKVVVLAGGLGTRLSEETGKIPKPMSEIGGRPILWHILSIYAAAGFREFVIAAGYKGEVIAQYFSDFHLKSSDWVFSLEDSSRRLLENRNPNWQVAIVQKPQASEGWINGGFFVFEPGIFEYLDSEASLEGRPLERLAQVGQLMAFRHCGFWHPMDTLRDKRVLDGLWASGQAPWKPGTGS